MVIPTDNDNDHGDDDDYDYDEDSMEQKNEYTKSIHKVLVLPYHSNKQNIFSF